MSKVADKIGGQFAEEDKKRMDKMEREMLDLKTKLSCLEVNMSKNNEDISKKIGMMEQQQQTTNIDIKSMFAQLIAEIGSIKNTVAATTVAAEVTTEQERKKPRVESPAPVS